MNKIPKILIGVLVFVVLCGCTQEPKTEYSVCYGNAHVEGAVIVQKLVDDELLIWVNPECYPKFRLVDTQPEL